MKSFSEYIVKKTAIKQNLVQYKKIDDTSKICAVVKADGYGIGAKNVVDSIDENVDYYAVACFTEAEKLRLMTSKPILILNFVPEECLEMCASKNISISISKLCEVKQVIKMKCHEKIKIHLAINTGMNRIGFSSLTEFQQTLKLIKKYKNQIEIEGIYSHLYNAENFINSKKQIRIFMQYVKLLSKNFDLSKILVHICASLGAIKYKKWRFDMVRLGILLYGGLKTKKFSLQDALEIKSKIIAINDIKVGDSIGYGKNYIADHDMKVATIPLGYADGFFRNYANLGYVKIKDSKSKILGNVCMDMFMVDVTNKNVKIGDNVELIGKNIPLFKVANNAQTISYEILTNIKRDRFNIKIE